jgi:hypothetical protein
VRSIIERQDFFRHLRASVDLDAGDPPDTRAIGSLGFLGFGGRERDPKLALGQLKGVLGMAADDAEETDPGPNDPDDSSAPSTGTRSPKRGPRRAVS